MAKILNRQKILKTDFADRFLGFIEKYDEIIHPGTLSVARHWVEYNEWNYIRYFLSNSPMEYSIPFQIRDFIYMSECELKAWQEHVIKISALLDEKNSLYHELISFCEEN